jgi:hypothetical protein
MGEKKKTGSNEQKMSKEELKKLKLKEKLERERRKNIERARMTLSRY